MTNMRNLTYDFVRRTQANLETIERLARSEPREHFEITQLINSCVGLLFVPTEDQIDRLKSIGIADFLNGIEPPRILYGALRHDNAAGLIRYLRNAFAHLNFDFEYMNNQISGVYVWNVDADKKVNWVSFIGQADLRGLLQKLADNYLTVIQVTDDNTLRLERVEKQTGKSLRLTNPSFR